MPVRYHIDGRLVFIEFSGEHTLEEARETWLAIESDPAYVRPGRVCVDVRASRSLGRRRFSELRENARWLAERARVPGRAGAFVARPGLQYGLLRMGTTWLEFSGVLVCVTTEPSEAVRWLRSLDSADHQVDCR